MYALYNSSDRGSIKNFSVINARKEGCFCKVLLEINNKEYVIERFSKKTNNQNSLTELSFFEIDNNNNVINDLTGLQRSDTDKNIRKLIGSSDDFILTSLSLQGQINKLISEGSTYRRSIISRFIGIDIFDTLLSYARDDMNLIKHEIMKYSERNWDKKIKELKEEINLMSLKRIQLNTSVVEYKKNLEKYNTELFSLELSTDNKNFSQEKLLEKENEVSKLEILIQKDNFDVKKLKENLESLNKNLNNIENKIDVTNIKNIENQLKIREELQKSVVNLKHEYKHELSVLQEKESSVKILSTVPCKEMFPTCIFIKNSHENKKSLPKQHKKVNDLCENLNVVSRKLSDIVDDKLDKKINEYNDSLKEKDNIKNQIEKLNLSKQKSEYNIEKNSSLLKTETNILDDIKSKINNLKLYNILISLKQSIRATNESIEKLSNELISINSNILFSEKQIKELQDEKKDYKNKKNTWEIYQLINNAFSKHGIPAKIINEKLPVINSEISKILKGICNFTLELCIEDNNSMEIYLDYGDSKRPIETGSGMEKVISSLALRVALLRISSLPKNDMLIIDEGFGSLDEINIEFCGRLLKSLKKYFKNIIIISHVDEIKDIVDDTLEITKIGIDSKILYA